MTQPEVPCVLIRFIDGIVGVLGYFVRRGLHGPPEIRH
jgi:hypothetical protein